MAIHHEIAVEHNIHKTGKPYVARIVGTHPRYGLDREFLPLSWGYRSRSGQTGTRYATVTEPGVFEAQSPGRKGPERRYLAVLTDGSVRELSGPREALEVLERGLDPEPAAELTTA